MKPKPTVEELIAEKLRLSGEAERIKTRVAALSAEIDAHLTPFRGQQQQQPQPLKAQKSAAPTSSESGT